MAKTAAVKKNTPAAPYPACINTARGMPSTKLYRLAFVPGTRPALIAGFCS
jgi:hypothetical protein